jgi:tellurite methyltransferase
MNREPFWERAYREGDVDPFGSASSEVLELLTTLSPGSSVLDLGCGAGRNALAFARSGMVVTAVDVSPAACSRLRSASDELAAGICVVQEDIRRFDFSQHHDVVVAHGVLHLLPRADRLAVLDRIKSSTVAGGTNIVCVFTNRLPAPPDLAEVTLGLFDEGEIFDAYRQWDIVLERAYTMHDEHAAGIRHEHPVNKIVARRPTANGSAR